MKPDSLSFLTLFEQTSASFGVWQPFGDLWTIPAMFTYIIIQKFIGQYVCCAISCMCNITEAKYPIQGE